MITLAYRILKFFHRLVLRFLFTRKPHSTNAEINYNPSLGRAHFSRGPAERSGEQGRTTEDGGKTDD